MESYGIVNQMMTSFVLGYQIFYRLLEIRQKEYKIQNQFARSWDF